MKAKFIDIDTLDAIEDVYLKEYSKGEYYHKQSFSWGFQEGVNWVLNKITNQTNESIKENNSYYFY